MVTVDVRCRDPIRCETKPFTGGPLRVVATTSVFIVVSMTPPSHGETWHDLRLTPTLLRMDENQLSITLLHRATGLKERGKRVAIPQTFLMCRIYLGYLRFFT